MKRPPDEPLTTTERIDGAPAATVRRFRLLDGRGAIVFESSSDRCAIGSHASNDVRIEQPTVSRFHCEIQLTPRGAMVRDLGSRNGTVLDGVTVVEAALRGDSVIRLGHESLRFELGEEENLVELSKRSSLGGLVGSSLAMRAVFAVLERASASDAIVLLQGETGTGKEAAAQTLHDAGPRRAGPFVVVDCGCIPKDLLESELFGHERGAFTGADRRRVGAFEEADGGTVFLDEIGELPLDVQPKLLRAIQQREVRPVGANQHRTVDVRIVAASNRDLRQEVNSGRFRSDLYYRLAVVKVQLPTLRSRPEDIPALVEQLLGTLKVSGGAVREHLTSPAFLANLQRHAWPGNVRELRNFIERCLVFERPLPVGEGGGRAPAPVDGKLPYEEARRIALEQFERAYLAALLEEHRGSVAEAARAAGLHRGSLYRLLQRHRLEP
jgi:DNA-binding NtrC family response regulator